MNPINGGRLELSDALCRKRSRDTLLLSVHNNFQQLSKRDWTSDVKPETTPTNNWHVVLCVGRTKSVGSNSTGLSGTGKYNCMKIYRRLPQQMELNIFKRTTGSDFYIGW